MKGRVLNNNRQDTIEMINIIVGFQYCWPANNIGIFENGVSTMKNDGSRLIRASVSVLLEFYSFQKWLQMKI